MSHPFLVGVLYLMVAFGLEFGALPVFGETWGEFARYVPPGEIRLVALGVMLAGLLRDEAHAIVFAIVGALLAGCMPGPGYVGCTMFSFILVAILASIAHRLFYMEQATVRFAVIFLLVLAESAAWSWSRRLFWPETRIEIQWWAHAFTAIIGAGLYPVLKRWLHVRPEPLVSIGRKNPYATPGGAAAGARARGRSPIPPGGA